MRWSIIRVLCCAPVLSALVLLVPGGFAAASATRNGSSTSTVYFVIGNSEAATGSSVEYWGAQWAADNPMTTGKAPDSFKGFADTVTFEGGNPCAGSFVARTGDSADPPASVPATVLVLVADQVIQSGPLISGTFSDVVEVRTNPGYGPAPGHAGTGTVGTSVCSGGAGGQSTNNAPGALS